MNVTHYRNFVKIVELGTITAAAKELYIAQPALSKQMKAMEEAFGTPLLTRGTKRVYPTNAGKILYDKAKRICLLEDTVQKEIESCKEGHRGTLNLGLTPAYPDEAMNKLIIDFSEAYTNVDFNIVEENSNTLEELVKKGTIELAVIRTPADLPAIFKVPLSMKEQLLVAFHKQSPWLSPAMDTVHFHELDGIPLCTSRGIEPQITDNCLAAGVTPHYLCISSSRSKALMWCQRGAAVSIYVGQPKKDTLDNPVCHRPLVGKNTETRRSFIALKERDQSAVAQLFLEFTKSQH
jgi:DNA-binding transcriptional LysR family regulator